MGKRSFTCAFLGAAMMYAPCGLFAQDANAPKEAPAAQAVQQMSGTSCATGGCATGYTPSAPSAIVGCATGGCGSVAVDSGCGIGGGCGVAGGGCGMGAASSGCSSCDLGDAFEICDGSNGIDIGGWIQLGYHSESTGLFNNRPDELNLHQSWLYAEKVADGSNGLDWGFRADFMYGIDGTDTQAFGNPPGSWDFQNGFDHGPQSFALPQMYVELASGDWSVIAGHFYTLIGYEVVTAPDNFFYSHANTMYNSEPFTHTGVLATYSASEDVELYGGWTAGWDTGFDQLDGGSNFLGGGSISLTDSTTLTYITTAGDLGARGNGYSHSIVLDVALSDNLNYVFQSDYLDANDRDYGVNQYLFYTVNDCVAFGGRFEWWNDDGLDVLQGTLGMNYKPHANVIVRPEVRWDKVDDLNVDQTGFGIDAIFTF